MRLVGTYTAGMVGLHFDIFIEGWGACWEREVCVLGIIEEWTLGLRNKGIEFHLPPILFWFSWPIQPSLG